MFGFVRRNKGEIMIFSSQYIDIGTGSLSDVLASTAQFFKKISLDTSKLKKQRVYESYNIPETESIIAFGKTHMLTITYYNGGFIFTDKALYFFSNPLKKETLTRIPYINFDEYIVMRSELKAASSSVGRTSGVMLYKDGQRIDMCTNTLLFDNATGDELFAILLNIQNKLCACNQNAYNKRDKIIQDFIESYKSKFRTQEVSDDDTLVIVNIAFIKDYTDKMYYVLAEKIYRTCNTFVYNKTLETAKDKLSGNMYRKLLEPNSLFSAGLIADLSNVNLEFSDSYLDYALNETTANGYNPEHCKEKEIARALITLRSFDFASAKEIINEIKKEFGIDEVRIIEDFMLLFGNITMKKVIDDILVGKEFDSKYAGIVDGLGLTPLHYGLLLGNMDYLKSIVSLHDWSDYNIKTSNVDIENVYNYAMIYCLKYGKDQSYFDELLKYTDKQIKELHEQIEMAWSQAQEAHDAHEQLDKYEWASAKRANQLRERDIGYSTYLELQNNIDDIKEQKHQVMDAFGEALNQHKKLKDDLYKLQEYKFKTAVNESIRLKQSSNKYVNFLMDLYLGNNDKLNLRKPFVEFSSSKCRVYQIEELMILLPDYINLNYPYRILIVDENELKEEIPNEDDMFPQKKYKESWYSKEAHNNIDILTDEYRTLAKLYHPDVCNKEYANDVFAEISQEFHELSEQLK